MNAIKVNDTVQTETRDVGKVRAIDGKNVIVWHPYSGIRTYHIDSVKKLY